MEYAVVARCCRTLREVAEDVETYHQTYQTEAEARAAMAERPHSTLKVVRVTTEEV